nr:MAG: RNA-dependent RNA polymerase [Riboviria sp.]
MKSVEELLRTCLKEAGAYCCVATTRDEQTLVARLEHEGLAFAAITLPAFDKDLCEALAVGRVDSNHFAGFQRSGGLPRFLGGFLRRVFHVDGTVRVDADVSCIRAVRQVCLLLSKVEMPVSPKRISKTLRGYVSTDQAIEPLDPRFLEDFKQAATVLLGRYFDVVEQELVFQPLPGRHGSGAVADRLSQNGKWAANVWTERLHEIVP